MKGLFYRFILALDAFALFLCGLAFMDFILHPIAGDFTYDSIFFRAVSMLVLTPLTLLVGFLVIRRVPGNVVGPLLILWSGVVVIGSLRLGIGAVPFSFFMFHDIAVGWFALNLMLLHFPDGSIYPPRLAPWLYSLFGIAFLLSVLIFLSTATNYGVANPFFVPDLQGYKLIRFVVGAIILILISVFGSLVLRYRKGSLLERQQIKWLALLGTILAAGTILGFIVYPLLTGGNMFSREDNLFSMAFFFTLGLFPALSIGVAVLRYRLWDLDIIIRRTLVYSILTVTLTLIYLGSVLLLQEFFQLITGEHQSQIATVLSTLVIIALMGRLAWRIQSAIDPRFYRQKYDAERVLSAFGATLREKVDLDELSEQLLSVVQETMQPARMSLWLRSTKGRS